MKKNTKSHGGKVNKGAPSGLIISLIFHAAAFFIAGLFVVFTVVNKKETTFVPAPPVERPKMQLKKPKVKVKKSSQPKPSSRIVAKVKSREMPEIQLPDLMGTGTGLLGGSDMGGEFMDLPDIAELTVFGGEETTGNDMEVVFYSMVRSRNGGDKPITYDDYFTIVADFVNSGWNKQKLSRFYRSPKKLYATTIMIPFNSSMLGPAAFNESMDYGYCWMAHYQGKLVHKDGITFRFWGGSDDLLVVRVDGEVALKGCLEFVPGEIPYGLEQTVQIAPEWSSKAVNNRSYWLANSLMAGSDWITLEPGVPLDFEAIVGEGPGGEFHAGLLVEVKGEDYPLNDRGSPIFPVFAMEDLTWELQDSILEYIWDGDANVTNVTTIFKDY